MSIYRRRLMIANALKKSDSNINYPGLIAAWSAAGKSNDDADRNVLRDLTGNGHDITLNGFAFSEMSGYGGYTETWKNWTGAYIVNKTNNKLELYIRGASIINCSVSADAASNFNVKITGLDKNNAYIQIGNAGDLMMLAETDGTYVFDIDKYKQLYPTEKYIGIKTLSKDNNVTYPIKNIITLEILPEYPDALVFDGVDDYGINEDTPILTEYTFISCLKWITEPDAPVYPFAKGGGLDSNTIFSGHSSNGRAVVNVYNFGFRNNVKGYTQELINYQNPTFYNNKNIAEGSATDLNYPFLLGKFSNKHTPANMAFYSAYLFDRSLDEQEIKAFIRKYIDADYVLPSEQTTE